MTAIVVPFPSYNPPQLPLYQLQTEPTPNEPPDNTKVEDEPVQIVDGVPFAILAGVALVFKVIIVLKQLVVLHIPSALT